MIVQKTATSGRRDVFTAALKMSTISKRIRHDCPVRGGGGGGGGEGGVCAEEKPFPNFQS